MQLSPTSYALLGLLALRSWTTYELAQQAERSLRYLYPRAERHLYAEAKRLAAAGLAETEVHYTGKRRSTTYRITPDGRAAVGAWLASPVAPPVLEAEVLLRAFFADLGTTDDLIAALDAAAEQSRAAQRDLAEFARARLAGDAPFLERNSVVVLAMRFVVEFHREMEAWATWAAAEVAAWERADGQGWDGLRAAFEDIAAHGPDR
jgi:DNA-binding PadR family transcriptional regulator